MIVLRLTMKLKFAWKTVLCKVKSKEDFEENLPYLKMLNAKVTYALGRRLITEKFKNFISKSLDQVKDKKDLSVFASFFEAFMGFYREHGD